MHLALVSRECVNTWMATMRCDRCGACMLKTELYLSKEAVKLKTISAWRCDKCGRIEYYGSQSPQAKGMF